MSHPVFSLEINDSGFFWNEEFLNRMNQRAERIFSFDPKLIKGARVLDIGARHGFWSWAAHKMGARETVGVEGRQASADRGTKLMAPLSHRFTIGNAFEILPAMVTAGDRYDVILNLGFFYHIYDHAGMLRIMDELQPKIIVIDSEIDDSDDAVIRVRQEKTMEPNNAIAEVAGQALAPVGNPSRGTIEMIADCYDYDVTWADWSGLKMGEGCDDYVERRRFTCYLTKRSAKA